jgi:riboflavin synthase alpha subunit
MFTGLVHEIGTIASTAHRQGVVLVRIAAPRTSAGLAPGDSLAVDGICLTVTGLAGPHVTVEASPETRRVTTLARWRPGRPVHLEPALRAGDALGGHFVLGHVDGTGRITGVTRSGGVATLGIGAPAALCRQMLPKGSIAVDGVSLTLDEGPFERRFTVTLVPHTLRETRFGAARVGDAVNIEVDVLSKAAVRADARAAPGSTLTIGSILAKGWS